MWSFHNQIDNELEKILMASENQTMSIFCEFMSRAAKFEELVKIGLKFLTGFCQELEMFKRPPIYKSSDVVDKIIEANQTDRMKAYVDAGCRQRHRDVQNMSNLHSCRQGLEDHRVKAKILLDELESLKEDAMDIAKMENDCTPETDYEYYGDHTEYEGLPLKEDYTKESLHVQDKSVLYTVLMIVVYNMLMLDYTMQEKIINSIGSIDTTPEQIESYCSMWDLQPYVDDNIIGQCWKHVSSKNNDSKESTN